MFPVLVKNVLKIALVTAVMRSLFHPTLARRMLRQRRTASTEQISSSATVSYILEPFEVADGFETLVYNNEGSLRLISDKQQYLHGDAALRVEYEIVATENWGGFVAFNLLLPSEGIYYNCHGATDLVLNYKVLEGQSNPERGHLRLVVSDGGSSDCKGTNCSLHVNLENYYSFHYILDGNKNNDTNVWEEIRVPLMGSLAEDSPFWNPKWEGIVGNGILDIETLKGWKIELNIDSQGGIGTNTSGVILVDQLRCEGGADLFGSGFHSSNVSDTVLMSDMAGWEEDYTSELAKELSYSTFNSSDGYVAINYTLEQTEDGFGRNDATYFSVGNSYYNLSQADDVRMNYSIIEQAEPPNRTSINLVLLGGGSDSYSSSQYILDSFSSQGSGSRENSVIEIHFVSNMTFDTSFVKGYKIQLNTDGQGKTGSTISGVVAVGDLVAESISNLGNDTIDDEVITMVTKYVEEPLLSYDLSSSVFTRVEFMPTVERCYKECLSGGTCIYFLTDGRDCYMASNLNSEAMDLADTSRKEMDFEVCWLDDSERRGEYCDLCYCDKDQLLIDCRFVDLKILPTIFNEASIWRPRILDLRKNPDLTMIGAGSFASIADSLEEIRLPFNLAHLSYDAVSGLPALDRVLFESPPEDDDGENSNGCSSTCANSLNNVITHKADFFGSYLCCGLSSSQYVDLSVPAEGLTFCDMNVDTIGSDTIYAPFMQYFEATVLKEITESSDFMGEAAKSPEACSEYCQLISGCNYFSYDQRWREAEHTCFLLEDTGERQDPICCDPDDYGDVDMLTPGWTSGIPPESRKDAVIFVEPRELSLDEDNGRIEVFEVYLGANPLRGSVVVTPTLNMARADLDIIITPPRVVLYDNETKAVVTVAAVGADAISDDQVIILDLDVAACDSAFTIMASATKSSVYIDISHNMSMSQTSIILLSVISVLVIIAVAAVSVAIFRRRKRDDSAWMIDPSELHYSTPPVVLGSGTFGHVLLATYRGTNVAVKRVLPGHPSSSESTTSIYFARNGRLSSSGESLPTINGDESRKTFWKASMDILRSKGGGSGKTFIRLRQDFATEIRVLSRLRHPCIITVMGAVTGRGSEPLLVMEQMEYGTLFDVIRNETMPFEGDFVLSVLRDISQGMRFLHESSPPIVHGDLKAANILVDSRFHVKIADFGLSQKSKLGIVGTPYWQAPELLLPDNINCTNSTASDVYSFGIVLYEIYSRKEPYEGDDFVGDVLTQVADPQINRRPPIPPSMPAAIQTLTTECYFADPNIRPSFQEIHERLKRLSETLVEPGLVINTKQLRKARRQSGTHMSTQQIDEQYPISIQGKELQITEKLLFEIFPKHIALDLLAGRKVEPESREIVTVFFSDIVGFTKLASQLTPIKISDLLDRLYSKFDELSRKHDVFKVETIGDAFMAATNLVKDQEDHVKRIAEFSIEAVKLANQTLVDSEDPEKGVVNIRCGFHSGPCVANVVGSRNPRYCLFGDVVNTASRMESNSEANRIQCSKRSAVILRQLHPEVKLKKRGKVKVKGKGIIVCFWVNEDGCKEDKDSLTDRSARVSSVGSVNSEVQRIGNDRSLRTSSIGSMNSEAQKTINSQKTENSQLTVKSHQTHPRRKSHQSHPRRNRKLRKVNNPVDDAFDFLSCEF